MMYPMRKNYFRVRLACWSDDIDHEIQKISKHAGKGYAVERQDFNWVHVHIISSHASSRSSIKIHDFKYILTLAEVRFISLEAYDSWAGYNMSLRVNPMNVYWLEPKSMTMRTLLYNWRKSRVYYHLNQLLELTP